MPKMLAGSILLLVATLAAGRESPRGVFLNVRDGTRVKTPDKATVYLVDRGVLRPLEYSAYQRLYRGWKTTQVVEIPLHLIGDTLNGQTRLVRAEGARAVWFIDNGETKRHVKSMAPYGFPWSRVKIVKPHEIEQIPEGPPLE